VTQRDLEKYLEIEIFGSKLAEFGTKIDFQTFLLKNLGANLHLWKGVTGHRIDFLWSPR
jgi:hypothetical protein